MFLEVKRYRWVENRREARRLLAMAVEEAPQVAAVIDATGQVISALELQMDNSRLPININDTLPTQNNATQNNAGNNDDNSNAGAAAAASSSAAASSAISMPDDSKRKEDIKMKSEKDSLIGPNKGYEDVSVKSEKNSRIGPKRGYDSILTPKKSLNKKDDSLKDKSPAKRGEVPVEDKVYRTPNQEELKKALSAGGHTKKWQPKLDATPAPFNAGSPRASSTYLEQPRPLSPRSSSPRSPERSPKSQILYRTVRMQGLSFKFYFLKLFKR